MFKKTFLKVKRRSAFSLVVSLVMMAFMLLIAIAVVAFVVVQSRLTEYKTKRFQAQNNAITGLRVALSQLQLLTGDDQRVTATADILGDGSNKSLKQGLPADGKRYWTGVWATGGLDKSKVRDWSIYNPNDKPFLGWLVSNEVNGVSTPLDLPVSPESALSGSGSNLLKEATKGLKVDSEKVLLVDAGSLSSKSDASKINNLYARQVYASRIQMGTETGRTGINKFGGSYAYWVGDEGVKARVNLVDSYGRSGKSEFNGLTDWDRGFRSVAQRNGVEKITGLEDFFSWWQKDVSNNLAPYGKNTLLSFVGSPKGLSLYAKGNSGVLQIENTQRLFHDISFSSKSVLSDVYNGGLKTDLSLAFEMPWFSGDEDGWNNGFRDIKLFHGSGDKNDLNLVGKYYSVDQNKNNRWWLEQPKDGLGFLYEFDTKISSRSLMNNQDILRGPTWDLLRNHYRLYKKENEKYGLRGFKPLDNDTRIAVGMAPWSYLAGENAQAIGVTSGGHFGQKGNYSVVLCRTKVIGWGDRTCLLPSFSGGEVGVRLRGNSLVPMPLLLPQSARLAPVVQRIAMRYSVVLNQDTASVVFDPIITIHNPYNVPIEFFGFGMYWTKHFPFKLRLNRLDVDEKGVARNWPGKNSPTFESDLGLSGTSNGVIVCLSRIFAGTKDFGQNPSGSIRMEPGEIKALFPYSKTSKGSIKWGTVVGLSSFDYEERSQMASSLGLNMAAFKEEDANLIYSVDVLQSGMPLDLELYMFNLYYPESSVGGDLRNQEGLSRVWRIPNGKAAMDVSDEHFTQVVGTTRFKNEDGNFNNFAGKAFMRTTESGLQEANKNYFICIDAYRAGAKESPLAGPLATNARAWAISPLNYDSNMQVNPIGVGWKRELRKDTGFSPVASNNQNAYWGDSINTDGESHVVLFEIPERPLTSIGQLQHADCSVLDMEPGYVIGNSYPSLGIKDTQEVFFWPDVNYMQTGASSNYTSEHSPQPRFDSSFASNLALFDRFYFSGVNFGDYAGQEKTMPDFIERLIDKNENIFANRRINLIRDFNNRTVEEVKDDFYSPIKITRNLFLEGGFNVNSTSVDAWKALYSGLNQQFLKIDGEFKQASEIPIVRFISTIGQKLGGGKSKAKNNEGDGWRWYRSLTDKEITNLAEETVKQVRMRGPFMSLADFVNRRLDSSDLGKSGAIQAAIDSTNINKDMKTTSNPDVNRYPNLYPTTNNPSTKAGAPGYLTQADILGNIGAGLTARSDTFTIRVYGDTFGFSGNPESRVWCEAVVQRTPDFIVKEKENKDEMLDVSMFVENYRTLQKQFDNPQIYEKFERNNDLNPVNKLLGRRYKIISFRWLSQNEI